MELKPSLLPNPGLGQTSLAQQRRRFAAAATKNKLEPDLRRLLGDMETLFGSTQGRKDQSAHFKAR